MDRGAWQVIVHGVTESDPLIPFHFHVLYTLSYFLQF